MSKRDDVENIKSKLTVVEDEGSPWFGTLTYHSDEQGPLPAKTKVFWRHAKGGKARMKYTFSTRVGKNYVKVDPVEHSFELN